MIRRLIVWLEVTKKNVLWRGELIRAYPTRESFQKANAARSAAEISNIACISTKSRTEGYNDGWVNGHVAGFDHCLKLVRKVFRNDRDIALVEYHLGITH